MKSDYLRLADLAIAFAALDSPGATLSDLAAATKRSLGEVCYAVRRLQAGGLMLPGTRQVVTEPFLRFLRWGVPVAFPATVGGITRGIATARLPIPDETVATQHEALTEVEFVWPNPAGPSRGQAIRPPYPKAVEAALAKPAFGHLLGLVDLIRVGGMREKEAAIEALAARLTRSGA